ncbi:MAG: dihydrolipoyl dehydrogenase [Methanomassiliicoccales archaeon]|nr:MAG: dihydrolipoyl dehydrogenase [Methanomassiliicoccales archaeon]
MIEYDTIIIGSGAGMNVAAKASASGMKVAVLDRDPIGGTCLNRGCIPSKVMIHPADLIKQIQEAKNIGVFASVEGIDFELLMKRVWKIVLGDRREMEKGVSQDPNVDFHPQVGEFIADYTLRVGTKTMTAPKIVIASGARPHIPRIKEIGGVGFLTSRNVFNIKEPPDSLLIVGGGYIAVEFAHFFSSAGTKVTVIGRNPRLVPSEEPLVSEILKLRLSKYVRIYTNHEVTSANKENGGKTLIAKNRADGKHYKFKADEILIAAGRRSNSDLLKPEKSGVETDEKGWILVDKYLQTTKPYIYALGDATGRHQFRHTANMESEIVWANLFENRRKMVDEHAVPHAIFTHPQIGSVGLTEEEAKKEHQILVGIKRYIDTAKGYAMAEEDGVVKVIVDAGSKRILGAHIVGPEASVLVQLVVDLMNAERGDYLPLTRTQVIHPALSEVVTGAFANLAPPGGLHHHH